MRRISYNESTSSTHHMERAHVFAHSICTAEQYSLVIQLASPENIRRSEAPACLICSVHAHKEPNVFPHQIALKEESRNQGLSIYCTLDPPNTQCVASQFCLVHGTQWRLRLWSFPLTRCATTSDSPTVCRMIPLLFYRQGSRLFQAFTVEC
jgi:hypothetical protein